jgi:amidase
MTARRAERLPATGIGPAIVPGLERSRGGKTAMSGSRILAAAGAMLVAAGGAVAQERHEYDPGDTVYFTYCHAHPPALRINPGDTIVTRTRDASNDVYSVDDTTVFPKLDLSAVNPQTGPFYIEGAEPGDTLVVHINRIELDRDWGWGASIPYFGALAPEYKTMMLTEPAPDILHIWRFDRERMVGTLDMPNSRIGQVEIPLRPFFGTIGVAPAGKECWSSLTPGPHGANMDFREVVAGVTMHFPVYEPGALLMFGDGHAAQGHGEVDGAAVETSFGPVELTVDLIKGRSINWPRLINDDYIMSIGSTRPLIDAVRLACVDLVNWLVDDYGYDKWEAKQLLGQAAVLMIANVVDPQYSVACAIGHEYLPE